MTEKRLTYVPKGIVKAMPDMMAVDHELNKNGLLDNVLIVKAHQFDILAIIKLLYAVKKEPLGFSRLYEKSQIRMKKSFLNYLHLVENLGFIDKTQLEKGQHMPENPRQRVSYNLTDKGRLLLEFFGVD